MIALVEWPDSIGSRMTTPPRRLDGIAADDLICGPVGALDEHVGLDAAMMSGGVSSSKIDDRIDAGKRREHFGALELRIDRPRRTLVARAPRHRS